MSQEVARHSPEQLLRDAGLRVTRPRLAVLGALASHPHASADTVLGVVRRDLGAVSAQDVYDVLHVPADRGVARPNTEPPPDPRIGTRTTTQGVSNA